MYQDVTSATLGKHLNDITRELRDLENEDECFLSNEATKTKLMETLKTIKKAYYENNRHMASTNLDYDDKQVKQVYNPFIPTHENLKRNADQSNKYLNILSNMNITYKNLKPREARLISQFKYFLNANFDNIYNSYYDGVWMLGPDYFCEQPICFASNYLLAAFKRISIRTLKDVELVIFWIKEHRKTFEQYLANIKLGVKKGMVHSLEVCKSSSKTFSKLYSRVHRDGASSVVNMRFAQYILTEAKLFPLGALAAFKNKENKEYIVALKEALINDFGKPLKTLLTYLRSEHEQYCPPSDVASGLGGLPLAYEYLNGEPQEDKPTDKTLPTGEAIDVSAGYRKFMRYYTTSNTTGADAIRLGYKLVNKFYDEILVIAKKVTNIPNDNPAMIKKFKEILRKKDQFYNEKDFPESESNDEAYDKCDNDVDAEKYCPERWASLGKWFDNNNKILKEAKPAIKDLFYTSGAKKTTPECLVKLVAEYDPTNGVPSYMESDELCEEPASYFIPFFKNNMGPKYEDYNTNFHEARPGHHLQIQGFLENFKDECGGVSEWINYVVDYYPSFSEGWGVYAENPILLNDTNVLSGDENDVARYGLLKWQVWRALRLVVDVGFHENNMTRKEAQELFATYTWDDSDTVLKELTRYQGTPGQATSYTVGQQEILSLREKARVQLNDKFDIKDFHFQLLSQGQSPFDFVSSYIESYIRCTKDSNSSTFCNDILIKGGNKKKSSNSEKKSHMQTEVAKLFRLFKKKKHA